MHTPQAHWLVACPLNRTATRDERTLVHFAPDADISSLFSPHVLTTRIESDDSVGAVLWSVTMLALSTAWRTS
eukprot:500544-Amphidinium_carterae.1